MSWFSSLAHSVGNFFALPSNLNSLSDVADAVGLGVPAAPVLPASIDSVSAVDSAINDTVVSGRTLAASATSTEVSTPSVTNTDSFSRGINAREIVGSTRSASPTKRILYGRVRCGGALFFEEIKPPFLYHGFLLCARRVEAFRGLYLGNTQILFASLAPGIQPPLPFQGPNYQDRLALSVRLGLSDQGIDPLLAQDFTLLSTEFRQRGIATAVLRYAYGADFDEFQALWGSGGLPNPSFLIDGVRVPDPRNPAHVLDWDADDPDSVDAAEATWAWSDNASLCQAHYLTQRYGGRIRPQRIDWDKVAEAAAYDDELIGAGIKRHTINGLVTLDQSPAAVLGGMLTANRGFVHDAGGRIWVSSSKPRAAVVTITDGDICGPIEFRAAQPKRNCLNRVPMRFVSEDRDYQQVDGPLLDRTDLQAEDGEILQATLDLPFTRDYRRAERLQDAFLESSRLGKTLTIPVNLALLARARDQIIGAAVAVCSAIASQIDGTYIVLSLGFSEGFSTAMLSLAEYDPAIETAWNESDIRPFTVADLDVS